MPNAPRVSIVLAAHNQATWLGRTIDSVRAQTWTDWELIVVDDGSTDDTGALLRAATADPRISYFAEPHRERCAARNRGINAARGEWVAFLDGDDLWHPSKLARQLAALAAAPETAWCYTLARFIDASGFPLPIRKPPAPIAGHVFPRLIRANFMILASVMARRSILSTVGGFNERLPVLGCEDWDLWLRIARHAPVCVVSEELTGYRRHGRNTDAAQLLASGLAVLAQHYADATTPHVAALSHASAQARLLWYHAGAAAETSRRLAWPLMLRALQTAPQAALARPAVGALYRFAFGVAPITVARAAGSMPWPPVPDSAAANTTANPGCSSPE